MKPDVRQAEQREIDEEILAYVREMQQRAPVELESVFKFLSIQRRRRSITRTDVQDRLLYLADAGYVKQNLEWRGGEFKHWTITADGMDVMDGNAPPRNWRP